MALAHLIGEGRRDRPASRSSTPNASTPHRYSRADMLKLWRKDVGPGKPMQLDHSVSAAPSASSSHAAVPPAPSIPPTDRRERERSAGLVIDRGTLPRSRMGSAPGQGVMGVLSGLVPGTSGPTSPTTPNGIKPRSTATAHSSDSLVNGRESAANELMSRSRADPPVNAPTPWATREDSRRGGPLRSDVPVWRRGGAPLAPRRSVEPASNASPVPAPSSRSPPSSQPRESATLDALKSPPAQWDDELNKSTASSDLADFSVMPEASAPQPMSPLHEYEALPQEPPAAPSAPTTLLSDLDDPLLRRSTNGSIFPPGLEPPPPLPPIDGPIWSYRDPSGQTQGPFTSSQMQDWHRAGFFVPDLLVMCSRDPRGANLYEPLGSLIDRVRDAERPFFTAAAMQAQTVPAPMPLPWSSSVAHQPLPPSRGFTTSYDPFVAPQPTPPTDLWGGRLPASRVPSSSSTGLSPWDQLAQPSLSTPAVPSPSLLRSLAADADPLGGEDDLIRRRPSWPPQPQPSMADASPWSNATLPPIGRAGSFSLPPEDEATAPMLPIGTPPVFLSPSPSQVDLTSVTTEPEPLPVVEPVKPRPEPVVAPKPAPAPVRPTPAPRPVAVAPSSPEQPIKLPPPTKPVSPKISLKEIQMREAKLAEAARSAERERKAAQAARDAAAAQVASPAEETLPSSSTWADSTPSPSVSPSVSARAKPAWAKPIKPAAAASKGLSLMQIQADEAARQQQQAARLAAAKAVVNAPASVKGGYASAATASGAGWTTVASKAPVVPAVPSQPVPAPRPTMTVTRPTPKSVPGASQPVKPATPTPSSSSSEPPPLGPELRRWIKTSLVSFQANQDDFVALLSSMPLNPDADMLEIIADSVYANSSELDGRRWTSEFVRRRKDDALRKTGVVANGRSTAPAMPKPTSMADAVRAIPVVKAQPDNFRVVVKAQQAKKRK